MTESVPTGTVEGSLEPVPPETAPEVLDPSNQEVRAQLLASFDGMFAGTGGIDSWLGEATPQTVIDRLLELDARPLSRAQLNQLLVLSHEAGLSAGFFEFYWLRAPEHAYDVRVVAGFAEEYEGAEAILSLAHLSWGLRRFYTDSLLFFGNVRSAYRYLRDLTREELTGFYEQYCSDITELQARGPALPMRTIPRDERYLISEMACKSLARSSEDGNLRTVLREAYRLHFEETGTAKVGIAELLDSAPKEHQGQLTLAADALLEDEIASLEELDAKVETVVTTFEAAREAALQNTKLYLSMVEDLDVYVATSMRSRQDFRDMASFCDSIFKDDRLADLHVRYFDPTLSAADGHEDKGLIECLMVKSAKVLIYFAGVKESFGKDAEAAMALSQGKPVILYAPDHERRRFYRDVHPLGRLIDFRTGVANGWMVAKTPAEVAQLLERILRNEMVYTLERSKPGYLRLKEAVSGSVVRLQTNDSLLRETFWNYYHREQQSPLR